MINEMKMAQKLAQNISLFSLFVAQGPSSIIFVQKMAQRCGVWQIKRMTSQDQDQVSTKSNMFGFGGYSQMKF